MKDNSLEGKIALVTGANAGIGKETAAGIADRGATVVMVCRNKDKGEAALQEIKSRTGNDKLELMICDLASQDQIRKLTKDFQNKHSALHILVNNAGAYFSHHALTEGGIERQFAINHLAPFLLTNLLLDTIKASAPARIVTVSSKAHYGGQIQFEDLNFNKGEYDGLTVYRQSKLGNVLFAYELARKLEGSNVTSTTLHPGVIGTAIGAKNNSKLTGYLWALARLFMPNAKKGAETSLHLAISPEAEGVTAKYYDNCKAKKSKTLTYDEALAKKFWAVSEALTGLN